MIIHGIKTKSGSIRKKMNRKVSRDKFSCKCSFCGKKFKKPSQVKRQGCIKFLIYHSWGEGNFIESVGEEYQVVERRREDHGYGEEYNVEKGKWEALSYSL